MSSKQIASELFDMIKQRQTPKAKLPKGFGHKGLTSIEDLSQVSQLANNLQNVRERSLPPVQSNQPLRNYPQIPNHFVRGGKHLDMCPYQLEAAIIGILESDNELIQSTLKKLLSTGKIADERVGDLMNGIKNNLRMIDADYETRLKQYNDSNQAYMEAELQKQKDMSAASKQCLAAWSKVVQNLSKQMKQEPRIDNLGDEDRWLARALQYFDMLEEIKTGGHRLVVAKALRVDDHKLQAIIAKYTTIQEQEHMAFVDLYLQTTPTDELRELRWHIRNDDDREIIENELELRRAQEIRDEEDRLRYLEYRGHLQTHIQRKKYGY